MNSPTLQLSDGEGGNCDSDDHDEIVLCMRNQDATEIQNAFRNYSVRFWETLLIGSVFKL